MNLLLRPRLLIGPSVPGHRRHKFRLEPLVIQGIDEQDDEELIPLLVAIYARKSR